ncbi:MAG: YjbQ family protein [Candidatus Aureabacteria bacterium]|nr:YjbQ family protein [Candidatus Auribacterota bacterium]
MPVYREIIKLQTRGKEDMTDLSAQVEKIVSRSGIKEGLVHIFNVGSTASIGTIEFEPGLVEDFPAMMNKIAPPGRNYGHEQAWHDGNGHSHLQASLMGPGITLPVEKGALVCGTWQQVFHYEADNKPRHREIIVTVMGD